MSNPTPTTADLDVVVVGAGIVGLAAALFYAGGGILAARTGLLIQPEIDGDAVLYLALGALATALVAAATMVSTRWCTWPRSRRRVCVRTRRPSPTT